MTNLTRDTAAALLKQPADGTARRIEEQETLEKRFLDLKMELNRELHKINLRLNAFEREQRETLKSVLHALAMVVESRGGSD